MVSLARSRGVSCFQKKTAFCLKNIRQRLLSWTLTSANKTMHFQLKLFSMPCIVLRFDRYSTRECIESFNELFIWSGGALTWSSKIPIKILPCNYVLSGTTMLIIALPVKTMLVHHVVLSAIFNISLVSRTNILLSGEIGSKFYFLRAQHKNARQV